MAVVDQVAMLVASQHEIGRDSFRAQLEALWDPKGQPIDRCVVAHYLADLFDEEPPRELEWDLRALAAYESIPVDENTAPSFGPSLHLNLAKDYRAVGDFNMAEHHLNRVDATLHLLDDDRYATLIRDAAIRLRSYFLSPFQNGESSEAGAGR